MITLWGRRSSSNVQKVLWTLAELGLPFERQVVGGGFGGNREAAYLAMNPLGLIPVLRDDDTVMCESNAIVRYLAGAYGGDGFRPSDPPVLAKAEMWMEWQQQHVAPPVSDIFMQFCRTAPDLRKPEVVKAAEAKLDALYAIADRHLADHRYFAGERLCMGDVVMGIFQWRLSQLACRQPDAPHVSRWFGDLKSRRAYKAWVMVPVGLTPAEWTANETALG